MDIRKVQSEKYLLINDVEYLKWLNQIILKKGYLDTDLIWENGKSEMTDGDISNIKSLSNLYFEVSSYASKIYVYSITEENDTYYIIKVNKDYYRIGVTISPGQITYFCYSESEYTSNSSDVVDISDLSKIDYRAALIEEKLKEISDFIDDKRKEANIPPKAILEQINIYIAGLEES